jgi:hypothetical protein
MDTKLIIGILLIAATLALYVWISDHHLKNKINRQWLKMDEQMIDTDPWNPK